MLPHYGNDDLRPAISLLQPIPSCRETIKNAMAQVGLKHSRHAANKYIDATIATLTDESKRKLVNPENLEGARAAYSTGELERKTYESHDPNTNTMQTIIKEDDINPYELLRPQTGPITNEDDAGFSMLFVYNLIEL